jgi:hypothetical protein
MKAVLLAWLSPECGCFARVCRQCGLESPCHKRPPLSEWKLLPGKVPLEGPSPWYDLPDFFEAGPGCGAKLFNIDWPWFVESTSPPWKASGSGRDPTGDWGWPPPKGAESQPAGRDGSRADHSGSRVNWVRTLLPGS